MFKGKSTVVAYILLKLHMVLLKDFGEYNENKKKKVAIDSTIILEPAPGTSFGFQKVFLHYVTYS